MHTCADNPPERLMVRRLGGFLNSHRQTIRTMRDDGRRPGRRTAPRLGLLCLHAPLRGSETEVKHGRDVEGPFTQTVCICRHCFLRVRLMERPE